MKKIVIFAGYYLPKIGGYTKNIHELAKRLTKENHSVDVITCNTEKALEFEEIDGVNVYRLPSWNLLGENFPVPKPYFTTVKLIFKLFKYNKYNIINIQTRFFVICAIGWLISIFKRIPLIYQERGSIHSVVDNKVVYFINIIYDHTVGYLIIRTAKASLGVSKASTDFLRHLGAQNPIIMHNGIDLLPYVQAMPFPNLRQDGFINITFVGRLIYAKGVQDLISVFLLLKDNIKLIIVGDGSYKAELEKISENNPRIIFLGNQENEKIPSILKSTDIFVNTSYSEGLPTSVMEACAAGCAVIATDVGGTDEIVKDNETGLLYMPHDRDDLEEKLKFFIENPETMLNYGLKSKDYVKHEFSWDIIIKKWTNLLSKFE